MPTRFLPLLFAASLAACSREPAPGADETADNLVVIVVDTLRADRAGARMPNVDRLAKDGVAFEQAFSHAPITLPAHTALFSSRHPFQTGVTNNGQPVPRQVPVLSEWLAQNGYRTGAAVSLASLWPVAEGRGVDRGFGAWDPGTHVLTPGDERNADLDQRLDELTADAEPFFLFAHYADPHEPYNARDGAQRVLRVSLDGQPWDEFSIADMHYVDRPLELARGEHELLFESDVEFKLRDLRVRDERGPVALTFVEADLNEPARRLRVSFVADEKTGSLELSAWVHERPGDAEIPARYAREVAFADAAVGQLLDALRARGLYDTSTVVFTSDHGEALGEHGCIGHIVNLYDEMLHVPLIIKPARGHPARSPLRERRGDLVPHVDVAPTLLELLGLPRMAAMAGRSILDGDRRTLIAETRRPEAPRDLIALRDRRFKLVYDLDLDSFELYDLTKDPGELVNVYAERIEERPEWPEHLRELAATPIGTADPGLTPDAETRARLQALGYTGR